MGESLYINGLSRGRGTLDFLSTVHPVLLIENLTSITLTLHAILEKAAAPEQHDWLMLTAGHIWRQLTAYAKNRIMETSIEKYGADGAVVKLLEELEREPETRQFTTERQVSKEASNQLMFAMKAALSCKVEFYDEQGNIQTVEGIPHYDSSDYRHTLIELRSDEKIPVKFESVISCEL